MIFTLKTGLQRAPRAENPGMPTGKTAPIMQNRCQLKRNHQRNFGLGNHHVHKQQSRCIGFFVDAIGSKFI